MRPHCACLESDKAEAPRNVSAPDVHRHSQRAQTSLRSGQAAARKEGRQLLDAPWPLSPELRNEAGVD